MKGARPQTKDNAAKTKIRTDRGFAPADDVQSGQNKGKIRPRIGRLGRDLRKLVALLHHRALGEGLTVFAAFFLVEGDEIGA